MNLPTNKSFGLTFGTVFFLVFLYLYTNNNYFILNLITIFTSIIFFLLGFANSKVLHPLNFIWFKFGIFLSKLFTPLVLGIIFFLIVTPIGIIMRSLKKDLLGLKFSNKNSYWIKKEFKSKMKNQF